MMTESGILKALDAQTFRILPMTHLQLNVEHVIATFSSLPTCVVHAKVISDMIKYTDIYKELLNY